MPSDVFAGLKVWDMSWVGVGPLTARYLADYGATVVRLDTSKRPDPLRSAPPYPQGQPGLNNSLFYGDFNASKLGMGLDLSTEEGRLIALQLAEWADVVVESFVPGTMADWGLAYEDLKKVNPSLIMLSSCMQGQTGPRAQYPGYGNLMAALAGYYEITGWPDRGPVAVYGAYTDFIGQRFCASALIAALDHRRRTGEGQHIDVSQFEAGLTFLGTEFLDFETNDRVATRAGNADPYAAPHGNYPCRGNDRWIAIACFTDDHWNALCDLMGNPDWTKEFSTLAERKAREPELNERVAAWTGDWDRDELFYRLQPHLPAGPVHAQSDLYEDAQIVYRDYFEWVEHPVMGKVPYNGLQARLSKTPGFVHKPSPCIGEDSLYVLESILGKSEEESGRLLAEGVIEVTG